jgi:hypothetical protein
MPLTIQVRLDEQTRKRLRLLARELGWTFSQVVSEGLRVLEATHSRRRKQDIIGLGRFCSGIYDLGSHKSTCESLGVESSTPREADSEAIRDVGL